MAFFEHEQEVRFLEDALAMLIGRLGKRSRFVARPAGNRSYEWLEDDSDRGEKLIDQGEGAHRQGRDELIGSRRDDLGRDFAKEENQRRGGEDAQDRIHGPRREKKK